MRKFSGKAFSAALVLVACSTFANAGDVYVVGTIGSTMATDSANSDLRNSVKSAGGTASDLSNGTGFKALLGFQVSEHLAIEGGYISVGTLSTTLKVGSSSAVIDLKGTGFNVAVLGIVPVNDQFSVFGKLGYTSAKLEGSTTGFSSSQTKSSAGYGLGASYKLSQMLAIRGEFEKLYDDVNMASISLKFNF